MKNKLSPELAAAIFVIALFSVSVVFADTTTVLQLKKGQNNVSVDSFFYPVYVSTFVKNYPVVESVTLLDYGRSYGFVNVFGGVGLDFIVEQGKTYEIYVSEDVNVTLR